MFGRGREQTADVNYKHNVERDSNYVRGHEKSSLVDEKKKGKKRKEQTKQIKEEKGPMGEERATKAQQRSG